MAEEILKNGYIEFTPEVAKSYFDSFVFSGRNGKYYEQLGKGSIEKNDYEPQYTLYEYIYALRNGGLNEEYIVRQKEVITNPNILFDSDNAMPYLRQTTEKTGTNSVVIN